MESPAFSPSPLSLLPPPSARQRLTERVKNLARRHGLAVSAVANAAAFPELLTVLLDRIAAGHLDGLDWFTPERAEESCDPATLLGNVGSILSVGVAYWGVDDGKPEDGVP